MKKDKSKGHKDGPFPPLKSTSPGVWVQISAGDEGAAAGGGRRQVITEVMVAPNGRGWVMRTIVASAESEAVALCYIPKR